MIELGVVDSSPIIALQRIGRLDLLKASCRQIFMPEEVQSEVGFNVPWIDVRAVANRTFLESIEAQVDPGEAAAISLALEIPGSVLIMDDLPGRRLAVAAGLPVIGTAGILLRSKLEGRLASVKAVIEELHRVDFRMSSRLTTEVLRIAGELE